MARFLLLIAFFCTLSLYGQIDSVRLSPAFEFKDGIFLNFQQVKTNSPIPRSKIITDIPKWDINFYDKLLDQKYIYILDKGERRQIAVSKIWGYSDNGTLYIRWKDDFAKIGTKGALAHFIATEVTYFYNTPYYSWYYDPYTINTQTSRELRQFILDFYTGKVYPFTVSSILTLFKQYDPQLYQEYKRLRPSKQKKLRFYYLRKFNQRNSVYIYQYR